MCGEITEYLRRQKKVSLGELCKYFKSGKGAMEEVLEFGHTREKWEQISQLNSVEVS